MDRNTFQAFSEEVKSAALQRLVRPGILRETSEKLVQTSPTLKGVLPKVPKPGSFKIKESNVRGPWAPERMPEEKMDKQRWKQTAKDLPLVIAATGIGYGLGRTGAELAAKRLTKKGPVAGFAKHLPMVASMASSAGAYALGRARGKMKERRDVASETGKLAGVPPAPQSRRIPKKKRSDPWDYDPRPAELL
jgi:hypothetical protein